MTVGSNSSRLSCPMVKGKDKPFQWNIEIKPIAVEVESLNRQNQLDTLQINSQIWVINGDAFLEVSHECMD